MSDKNNFVGPFGFKPCDPMSAFHSKQIDKIQISHPDCKNMKFLGLVFISSIDFFQKNVSEKPFDTSIKLMASDLMLLGS